MKTVTTLKAYIIVILGVLLMISCEKPDAETEVTKEIGHEGYMSITGESDSILSKNLQEIASPILQMHFDKNVSKEEAFARFNKQASKFTGIIINPNSGTSKEWFYQIWTNTGVQANAQTDGTVHASVYFNTNKGGKHTAYVNLNNPGDDREGGWDAYLMKTSIPGQPVSWVETKHAHIRLKGTDGWFIKHFYVYVKSFHQSVPATGYTSIVSKPNQWLDNNTSTGWDYYHTGTVGHSRLNFLRYIGD